MRPSVCMRVTFLLCVCRLIGPAVVVTVVAFGCLFFPPPFRSLLRLVSPCLVLSCLVLSLDMSTRACTRISPHRQPVSRGRLASGATRLPSLFLCARISPSLLYDVCRRLLRTQRADQYTRCSVCVFFRVRPLSSPPPPLVFVARPVIPCLSVADAVIVADGGGGGGSAARQPCFDQCRLAIAAAVCMPASFTG